MGPVLPSQFAVIMRTRSRSCLPGGTFARRMRRHIVSLPGAGMIESRPAGRTYSEVRVGPACRAGLGLTFIDSRLVVRRRRDDTGGLGCGLLLSGHQFGALLERHDLVLNRKRLSGSGR